MSRTQTVLANLSTANSLSVCCWVLGDPAYSVFVGGPCSWNEMLPKGEPRLIKGVELNYNC